LNFHFDLKAAAPTMSLLACKPAMVKRRAALRGRSLLGFPCEVAVTMCSRLAWLCPPVIASSWIYTFATAPVQAVPLAIANRSFESPAYSDGGYAFLIPPSGQGMWGWVIDDGSFIYNAQAGDYAGAGGNGTPQGADGSQVGGVFGFGNYAISQRLVGADLTAGNSDDPVVEPGTVYTLTVSVGQRAIGNPFGNTWGGYDIQLLAGADRNGIVIGQETDVQIPPPGEFVTRTITIMCPTFTISDIVGQPLTVLLRKTTVSATATVEYDNVRLDAFKISPELDADFDDSGLVNAADLATWRQHFGENCLDATHDHGNADGDDEIGGTDLLQWQRTLGSSVPISAVPEPAAFIQAATVVLFTAARRRRNQWPAPAKLAGEVRETDCDDRPRLR
jgi:hypothetical protein